MILIPIAMILIIIFVETNWSDSWFAMAILGCMSLVLDKLNKYKYEYVAIAVY